MSMTPALATIRRAYGRQKRSAVADAAGQAVLDFGIPPKGITWVIHRLFVRGAAGMTVRMFTGSDPGDPTSIDPTDEFDAVTANPAVNSADEIAVTDEPVWALVTGAGAGTLVAGQIRYRQMTEEGY